VEVLCGIIPVDNSFGREPIQEKADRENNDRDSKMERRKKTN
jgi:hypothetical protein